MLTQLTTLRSRLGIIDTDTTNDLLLTNLLKAVSARFDRECNRTLARTVDATFEFPGEATEVAVPCYPIERVTRFELKTNESVGWVEQTEVEYLVCSRCVISLQHSLSPPGPGFGPMARVIYTGGYVLPGAEAAPGQSPLPDDLEQAAVDQTAYWFQNRDRLGLTRIWEYHATYRQFAELDLLSSVRAVLGAHTRWCA